MSVLHAMCILTFVNFRVVDGVYSHEPDRLIASIAIEPAASGYYS